MNEDEYEPYIENIMTCTKCNLEKSTICCFSNPTDSWCIKCRARQQQTREETKRSIYSDHIKQIKSLKLKISTKNDYINTLEELLKKETR